MRIYLTSRLRSRRRMRKPKRLPNRSERGKFGHPGVMY
jgi:hypothetical protein